jgi:ribosome-associated translation inhibitor RaiA
MKIQFTAKDLAVPHRAYTYAAHELEALDQMFLTEPKATVKFTTAEEKFDVALTIKAGSVVFKADGAAADLLVAETSAVAAVQHQMEEQAAALAGILTAPVAKPEAQPLLADRDRFHIVSI